MDIKHIRNFCIIAHIDHGKSTLSDRMLELTGTVEKRKMHEQVLDSMSLERERGITIKMQPVRMNYIHGGDEYVLNLIDTPGHIDFSYEVSRALSCVEGAILLIDATQGIQAQTLSVLDAARHAGLFIIPVLNKIDLPNAQVEDRKKEVSEFLNIDEEDILSISAKSGEGVEELLLRVIKDVPSPEVSHAHAPQALIFDFAYSDHQGVILYVRVFNGEISQNNKLVFLQGGRTFIAKEIGIFAPERQKKEKLSSGEIGYIVTGIKEPGVSQVGDTVSKEGESGTPIPGYEKPKPVVWVSLYPESKDQFEDLKKGLGELSLSDSSFSFEEETGGVLGRGFRCGFLGMLHVEIITERLRREFDVSLVLSSPTIVYRVKKNDGRDEEVYSPLAFPPHGSFSAVFEPWAHVDIITKDEHIGVLTKLIHEEYAGVVEKTESFGDTRSTLHLSMPLRELMRGFFDAVKSASSGYASLSYEIDPELRPADVVRLDVLLAGDIVPPFSRITSRTRLEKDARVLVDTLRELLPRQQFVVKIQAQAAGRIIASRTLPAYRKDVTAKLYGGDVTRKKKLLEKQKKGKKKAKEQGKVAIPQKVFVEVMRRS